MIKRINIKKEGKSMKKIFSLFMIMGMIMQIFAPIMVFATAYEDGSAISIGGTPTINGSTFEYANGDVTITKNGIAVNTTSFSVAQNDAIVITLTPDTDYNAQLYDGVRNNNVMLDNNTYSFIIGRASSDTLSFTPSFVPNQQQGGQGEQGNPNPLGDVVKFDCTINGESFTNVGVGDWINVSSNFNLNAITDFYITKIAVDGGETYTYEPHEYSYDLENVDGKKIFEVRNYTKISDNSVSFGLEIHSSDIQTKDFAAGKDASSYYGLYLTSLYFVKDAFRGVAASTELKPDSYDFTKWNGADLAGSTKSNPGKVTAYYGESTISLSSAVSSSISEINLVADGTVPSSAVSINKETGKITILSNYYNKIPLQIKLADGTIGYITINRIGIFISDVNAGIDTLYHGAIRNVNGNFNVQTDKNRIGAVFYHEDTTTYSDYDLIVNLLYKDGSTKTTIAEGVGDIRNESGNIIGSDYLLWAGARDSNLAKVSVIAIKKGTMSSDSKTFSGATFGSGAGVEWESR